MNRMTEDEQQKIELVEGALIRRCRNRLDAIRLCVQLSGLDQDTIAEKLHMDPGHLCRLLKGKGNFPDTKSVDLMRICGNYAPVQWESWACGFRLVPRASEERIRELEQQLAQARGALA